jgi:ATP-binding cassette subfamily B (MDR/TAP) protein 1
MVKKLVVKFGLSEAKTKSTPLALGINLVKAKEDEVLDKTQYPYGELVGNMLYLVVCTRPDIAHAVGVLARYMSAPSMEHWKIAKAVLRYVAGSASMGIKFGSTGTKKGTQVWLVTVTLILLVTLIAGGLRLDMCFCLMEEL